MSRRFCTTSGETLLLQGPCQPERARPGRAVLTLRFVHLGIDNLEGDTERVTFADGSEPLGEGGSSMLETKVHGWRRGAVVKMHLLPLAVLVGGFIYEAGEAIMPLYFIPTCRCPGLATCLGTGERV